MRNILRVGVIAAILGSVAVYGLARVSALVAAYGILLLGFAVGLAMAKWLDWSLYGRQVESGAQAGAIACVPAAVVALFALLSQDPRTVGNLESASRLGPVNAAGFAHAFAFAGWAGADILSVVFVTLFAIGLAALTSIVMGWSKNGRAVRSVSQAYEAARSLRAGTWNPGAVTAVPAMQGASTAIPAWQGGRPSGAPRGESAFAWQTAPQGAAVPPAAPYAPPAPLAFPGSGVSQSTAQPAPSVNSPADDTQLRAAMREALAMWGDESGEHEAGPPGDSSSSDATAPNAPAGKGGARSSRAPQASQFLNDSKKRGRKKADTRDWLC